MSINEKISDKLQTHHLYLLRFDAEERKKVLKELDKMFKDLDKILRNNPPTGKVRKAKFLKLRSFAQESISRYYSGIDGFIAGDLLELAELESLYVKKAINGVTRINLTSSVLTTEQIKSVAKGSLVEGAPTSEWWARQAVGTKQIFEDAIRQGMMRGEGIDEMRRRIFGTNKRPGIMEARKRTAEALTRSSVQSVANNARMEAYRKNGDVIKGIQWVSTLDGRTSLFCMSMDGLTWDLDYKPIGHGNEFIPPPAHWNCRSTTVPILKSAEELGVKSGDIPAGTRASMDGQVNAKETFGTWLEKKESQDPGFADKVLGKGRADLWREGKITMSQLTDFKGHTLTLAELKKL